MRLKRASRRNVLALTVAVGLVGAASVSVFLSESAWATTPGSRMQQLQLAAPQLPGNSAENWVPIDTQNTRIINGHAIGENSQGALRCKSFGNPRPNSAGRASHHGNLSGKAENTRRVRHDDHVAMSMRQDVPR